MLSKKGIVKVFGLSVIPAVSNYFLFRFIFQNDKIENFNLFIVVVGVFTFISSLHSQIIPTYNYVNRKELNQSNREAIRFLFLIINLIFGLLTALYFILGDFSFNGKAYLLLLGAFLVSHIVICIDYYYIQVNLRNDFVKGASLGLVLLISKAVAYLCCYFVNDIVYFFILDSLILLSFSILKRISIIPVLIRIDLFYLLKSLNPVVARLLYFNILPWVLYVFSIHLLPSVKESFFLAERVVFSGIGLIVTPFIPLFLISIDSNRYKLSHSQIRGIVLSLIVFEFTLYGVITNTDIMNILAAIFNIDPKIFNCFIAITPLHLFLSYCIRPSLLVDKTDNWKFYIATISFAFISVGYLTDIIHLFICLFITQIILCLFILKIFSTSKKDLVI